MLRSTWRIQNLFKKQEGKKCQGKVYEWNPRVVAFFFHVRNSGLFFPWLCDICSPLSVAWHEEWIDFSWRTHQTQQSATSYSVRVLPIICRFNPVVQCELKCHISFEIFFLVLKGNGMFKHGKPRMWDCRLWWKKTHQTWQLDYQILLGIILSSFFGN